MAPSLMRYIAGLGFVSLLVTAAASPALLAQQGGDAPARYGIGAWEADSFGNHRAVVQVAAPAPAVRVHIPWRRRDTHPELKRIVIRTADGRPVGNSIALSVTRESGDVAFEPIAGAGEYYVYFMPYQGTVRSNYPKITYPEPDSTADAGWLSANGLTGPDRRAGWSQLPAATLIEIQAPDSVDRMDPMEVIATRKATSALAAGAGGAAFLLFPEDRAHPIRMTADLPARWIAAGPGGPVTGLADRGEFFSFQIGVWALRPIDSVSVRFSALAGPGGAAIPASAFSSFMTGGVDWQGRAFHRRVEVDSGRVQSLWSGVMVPEQAVPGVYTGSVTIGATGASPVALAVRITVAAIRIADHGDDEPWRLSRLRWLDSRLRLDTTLVAPYTPVRVRGATLDVLGREIALAPTGLPAQITSFFTPEMTSIGTKGRPLLAGPVTFVAEQTGGRRLAWAGDGVRVTRSLPGAALWEATSHAGALAMHTRAQLDFDGNLEYIIAITASRRTSLDDIRLEIPFRRDVARYFMGLDRKGGTAPEGYDWRWDVKRNQDAVWIGDVNGGLQLTLKDQHYIRPLNTNFYQLRPLVMPESWDNGGKGGCRFRAAAAVYRATCYSGARTIAPGDTQFYNLRLLVTPFHAIDTRTHFTERYFHRYAPIDSIKALGANVVNVHHATAVNPYLNYPFLRPDAMKAYADSAHAAGMRMKIYYTVRELTYRAPEFWALRSLGTDAFAGGPGGGHSWLQEHVGTDYIAGWVVPELHDLTLVTSGISRWHNHYVEGLQWLVDHVGIDGLYLDDVAFDRITMQRIRRVLMSGGTPGERIDLHSANQFNPNDGFASSANLYMEHLPYIDRLWFGEYFDYKTSPPDYWLIEISGIPFGLMGEMLEGGGNPWRGMVFGMTNRLPWTGGDPRNLWKLWDVFGIADSRMLGWWAPSAPVRTGRDDVLATSYLRNGRALIAVASWAADTVAVPLTIDWKALGIDPARARLAAPAVEGFQPAATFRPGEAISVAPGRGWLILIDQP